MEFKGNREENGTYHYNRLVVWVKLNTSRNSVADKVNYLSRNNNGSVFGRKRYINFCSLLLPVSLVSAICGTIYLAEKNK